MEDNIKKRSLFDWFSPSLIPKESPLLKWMTLLIVIFMTIMAIATTLSSAAVLPVMQGNLAIGRDETQWIMNAFLVAIGVAVPISVTLAESFGYKWIFFLGSGIFGVGNILCALSGDYYLILFCRFISGCGSGFALCVSLGIIAKSFPKETTPLALALYSGLGFGFGFVLAFIIGGYMAQHFSWEASYVLTGIPCLLILPVIWMVMHETELVSFTEFDFLGYISFASFIILSILILTSAKANWNTEGWYSDIMQKLYFAAAFSLVVFIIAECNAKKPCIDLSLFRIRPFTIGCLLMFFIGTTLFGSALTFFSVFENVLNYQKDTAGFLMIPFGLAITIVSSFLGLLLSKIGIRLPAILGCTLLITSCFMQHRLGLFNDHMDYIRMLLVRGLGVAFSIGPITALALQRIEAPKLGLAALIVTLFRQIGAAFSNGVIEIITVERNDFHLARFSEQLTQSTYELSRVVTTYAGNIMTNFGVIESQANTLAKGVITADIAKQAYLLALNDAYFLFGIALSIMTVLMVLIMTIGISKEYLQKNKG